MAVRLFLVGFFCSLRGGGFPAALEPVAFAVHLQDVDVVGEPVQQRTAETLVAEIGTDVEPFHSPGHLASWAGMCPGNNESAGKRRSGRTRKANPWLRTTLVEAANAAVRTRNTYLSAQYHRLVFRLGRKKAIMAVAHSILIIIYHMLQRGSSYQELGHLHFDQLNRHSVERRLTRNLERLGYKVMLQPAA